MDNYFWVDYIGTIMFLQIWCEACSFSKIVFTKINMWMFFSEHIVIFPKSKLLEAFQQLLVKCLLHIN